MIALVIVFVFVVLLGAFSLAYQVYRLVVLDAESRGLKHPGFWGIFSVGGGKSGGGLVLYLIGRNKYPSAMTQENKAVFESRKRRAGLSLCFIAVGGIALVFLALFGNL